MPTIDDVTYEGLKKAYDEATAASFATREQDQKNLQNNYYNTVAANQGSALDTIRRAQANAIATGASKGMQNANMLTAILGLQKENAAGSTELAQAGSQLALEKQAAFEQNALDAMQLYNQNLQIKDTNNAQVEAMRVGTAAYQTQEAQKYMAEGNYEAAIQILSSIGANTAGVAEQANVAANKAAAQLAPADITALKALGVSNTQGAVNAATATANSFGSFVGTGKGKGQDTHVQNILNQAKAGQLKDGAVFDFNKGSGITKYVYYKGSFYPATKGATDGNANKTRMWDLFTKDFY